MIKKLANVIIAVKDLDDAVRAYEALGLRADHVRREPEGGMRNAVFQVGESNLELMEPTDPQNPITRFLERRGEGVYLVSLEVDDLAAEVQRLRSKGIDVAEQELENAPYRHAAFVHPRATKGVLIELHQRE